MRFKYLGVTRRAIHARLSSTIHFHRLLICIELLCDAMESLESLEGWKICGVQD